MIEHTYEALRQAMVASQLRTTAVSDARVLAAMAEVPRERYVAADRRALAYRDTAVPTAEGRALPAPMVLGRLLTEARVAAGDAVLIVGAGTGYAAAVAASLARRVVALEEDDALVAGPVPASVEQVSGPLAAGWRAGAPYDLVLFDGAIEEVPPAIVDQLAEGGRMAAPLVRDGVVRLAIGRKSAGAFGMTSFADAAAPVLPGFSKPLTFSF